MSAGARRRVHGRAGRRERGAGATGVHGMGRGVAVATCRMSFPHKLSSDEGMARFRELPPAEEDSDEGISGGGLVASGATGVAGSSGWPSGSFC